MSDFNRLNEEFKTNLMEQNEEHLDFIRHQEEPIIEKTSNNKWNNIFQQCLKTLDMNDL